MGSKHEFLFAIMSRTFYLRMATINIETLAVVKVQDALGDYREYLIEAENLNEMRQALDVNGLCDYKIIESDTLNIQGIIIKE